MQTTLKGYAVLGELARGGMGQVLLCQRQGPGGFRRVVVIKRMLPHLASVEEYRRMFEREAQVTGRMQHRNVVQALDYCDDDGAPYLVLEHVNGVSLRELQRTLAARHERVPVAVAVNLAIQALEGLQHAHALVDDAGQDLGVIHRDVSPDNLLLSFEGQVKVIDFGVVRASALEPLTSVGQVKGRIAYMPPEQLQGQPLDHRVDLFGMGAVLYELLSGQKAFRGDDEVALLQAVLACQPRPLAALRPGLPAALIEVVERAMAPTPAERYPSAAHMAAALRSLAPALPFSIGMAALLQLTFADRATARPEGLALKRSPEVPALRAEDMETRTVVQGRSSAAVALGGTVDGLLVATRALPALSQSDGLEAELLDAELLEDEGEALEGEALFEEAQPRALELNGEATRFGFKRATPPFGVPWQPTLERAALADDGAQTQPVPDMSDWFSHEETISAVLGPFTLSPPPASDSRPSL